MAISMSGAKVETDQRDSLLASTIDSSVTSGGVTANTQGTGLFGLGGQEATGAALAGVTSTFAANVSNKIDEYCANVNQRLAELQNVDTNVAFKGSGVSSALDRFIEAVKNVAISYTNKLKAAEQQIVNSVATAYATQDADLSGNMNADSGTLEGNMVN